MFILIHRIFRGLALLALVCVFAVDGLSAAEKLSGQSDSADRSTESSLIIQRADRVRAPSEPFKYSLTLIEMNHGKEIARQGFEVSMRFFKPDNEKEGDARALVLFVEPPIDRGKSLLSVFEKLWYYEPTLRRPIAISRQQRLIGQVSNGDVVATDYDFSYESMIEGEEACGEKICYRLALKRRASHVTYPRINYWVEKESYQPFKAEFVSVGGKVLKRAWYKDYREAGGALRPHEIVIEDSLKKEQYTRMLYSNLRIEDVPERYFQKEYLLRMR